MNIFEDIKIKKMARQENINAPESFSQKIDETLSNLEYKEIRKKTSFRHKLEYCFAIAVLAFVLFVNLNPEVTYAMQDIPVFGKIAKIVTIKNYFEKIGNLEINLNIPKIENEDNSYSKSNSEINSEVDELTIKILENYYAENNSENHNLVSVETEVIENNENYFTLKLTVFEVAGGSNTEYKYYNIDKKSDEVVELGDLFEGEEYKKVISDEIKSQMRNQMNKDENIIYWMDDEIDEFSFSTINENQNFYFSNNGNIVIVFNKYEVGPGYIGTPEFEINKNIYEKYLKK